MKLLFQILLRRHGEVDGGGLHHGPHAAAGAGDVPAGVGASVELEAPAGGLLQAADEADEGGLARPVAAHEAVDGPLFHVHCQPLQGLGGLVVLGQVIRLQNEIHVPCLLVVWDGTIVVWHGKGGGKGRG